MNSSDLPNRFVAKTSFGSFHIKISNRDYITIGTKQDCVQIAYKSKTNTAVLDWLGTAKGGCEASDKLIKGDDTVMMTDLGFTILKQLHPNVNPILSLTDSSTFPCSLPNGAKDSISQMIYQLLLTGKTYYQSRFNATLKYKDPNSNEKSAYDLFAKARTDPTRFDKDYDFENEELNATFAPIIQESSHWGEFFEKLNNKYGRKTCVLIHAWYKRVYGFLAQRSIHAEWVIDMSKRPTIEYTITERNSSRNFTRKSFQYNPFDFHGGYYPLYFSYRNILRKTKHKSNTMKQHYEN